MTAEDIITMIDTTVAGLEEQLELANEGDNLGLQISLAAKQAALMKLRYDILERREASR